ncbi:hypothetical protein K432DRAFT_384903 [Lepidopterella palustris CBS 459.81]|uniref:Uncharacterized protein n=1 Tax=Lepidopterella palustris CBS 459.81 TaxID=1314670 RepID=A0A8E2E4N0_9PEZI|nr:hypothetical protein K432DRAFT_384903 [Lepidopterella palustris CBS 459.81]
MTESTSKVKLPKKVPTLIEVSSGQSPGEEKMQQSKYAQLHDAPKRPSVNTNGQTPPSSAPSRPAALCPAPPSTLASYKYAFDTSAPRLPSRPPQSRPPQSRPVPPAARPAASMISAATYTSQDARSAPQSNLAERNTNSDSATYSPPAKNAMAQVSPSHRLPPLPSYAMPHHGVPPHNAIQSATNSVWNEPLSVPKPIPKTSFIKRSAVKIVSKAKGEPTPQVDENKEQLRGSPSAARDQPLLVKPVVKNTIQNSSTASSVKKLDTNGAIPNTTAKTLLVTKCSPITKNHGLAVDIPTLTSAARATRDPFMSTDEPSEAEVQKSVSATEDIAEQYVTLAAQYLNSLPENKGKPFTTDVIKNVAKELRISVTSTREPANISSEDEQKKYVSAAAAYLNDLPRNEGKQITGIAIYHVLRANQGDFLNLCARLVGMEFLSIKMDEVVGLANAVLAVLERPACDSDKSTYTSPKPAGDTSTTKSTSVVSPTPATISAGILPPAKNNAQTHVVDTKGPVIEKFAAWPEQAKREKPAQCRIACIKGVSSISTINKLQSLVWGGRVEIFHLDPGKPTAFVRFMTAEGFEKYFEGTANGVQIPGEKCSIFVDRGPGPNSVNDLLQTLIEAGATRCIRCVDADEDWKESTLFRIARGKNREVDKIVKGETEKGRTFIEFRFANIYNALSFKHEIQNDEDWEYCTVSYAPDPCEVATGTHLND